MVKIIGSRSPQMFYSQIHPDNLTKFTNIFSRKVALTNQIQVRQAAAEKFNG